MARYCYVENKITGKYYWIGKDVKNWDTKESDLGKYELVK